MKTAGTSPFSFSLLPLTKCSGPGEFQVALSAAVVFSRSRQDLYDSSAPRIAKNWAARRRGRGFWIGRDGLCQRQRPGKMLRKERAGFRRDRGKGADLFFGALNDRMIEQELFEDGGSM